MLKKAEHLPLYVSLANIIKERISNQQYQVGSSIPSEAELREEFAVSRTTVRKALKLLTDQNILIKLPGKGTYVSDNRNEVKTKKHQFSSLTDSVERAGKNMATRLISIEDTYGTDEQRSFFHLDATEQLIAINRLRYIDDVSFCLEWIWLPPKFDQLKSADLNRPLYQLLKEQFATIPSTGRKTFKIAFATKEESVLLNVDQNSPLMLIKDFVYDEKGQPLHITSQILRSDKLTYAIDH